MKGIDDDLKDLGQEHSFGFFNPKAGFFIPLHQNRMHIFHFLLLTVSQPRFQGGREIPKLTPKPETLYDTEIGYKLRTEKASLGVNFYGMIYKDQLVPTGQLSNVGYSIMTNVPKSYRTGMELAAGIKPADS